MEREKRHRGSTIRIIPGKKRRWKQWSLPATGKEGGESWVIESQKTKDPIDQVNAKRTLRKHGDFRHETNT